MRQTHIEVANKFFETGTSIGSSDFDYLVRLVELSYKFGLSNGRIVNNINIEYPATTKVISTNYVCKEDIKEAISCFEQMELGSSGFDMALSVLDTSYKNGVLDR